MDDDVHAMITPDIARSQSINQSIKLNKLTNRPVHLCAYSYMSI